MTDLKIAQITDLHLTAEKTAIINDINTYVSAQRVIEKIKNEYSNINSLILTGDLVNDESKQGYQNLNILLKEISCPIFLVPGNHDSIILTRSLTENKNIFYENFIVNGNWVIFMFNTKKENSLEGFLYQQEIFNLEQLLNVYPEKNFLIFMHHHLISINSKWMDSMIIENSEKLIQLISKHNNIKCISCGHVHQEFYNNIGNIDFYSTPSTCYQFMPKASSFALDKDSDPGFRLFNLKDDGSLISKVIRINIE